MLSNIDVFTFKLYLYCLNNNITYVFGMDFEFSFNLSIGQARVLQTVSLNC